MTSEAETAGTAPSEADAPAASHWFPEGFDSHSGEFLLVAADRSLLAAQTFLDGRWERSGLPRMRVASAAGRLPDTNDPARFIWHTGFCCSTLLARMLDRQGRNLSLCEPQVLVDIAATRRTGGISNDAASGAAQQALALLSRPFSPGEHVTIKPSPAANALLRLLPPHAARRMLFLYSDCRSFLISICKMGEDGRKYVRSLFLALLADGHVQARWPTAKLLIMSDLELAAMVWHMQIAEFLRVWPMLEPGSAASLDCDAFLASPGDTSIRLDELFSLGIGAEPLRDVIAGPLFRRNSKTGEAHFDVTRRADERRRIEQDIGDDLNRIVARSYQICRDTPRAAPLPDPLVAIEKSYCPGA